MIETIENDSAIYAAADSNAEANVEANHGERRRHPRYAFTATVEAFEAKSRTKIQGRTADISEGGCYVDTISPFPVDTIIRLRVVDENKSLEIPAKVVYSLTSMGMGVSFLFNAQEQINMVEKWIGMLNGEFQPETEAPAPVQQSHEEEGPNDKSYLVLQELIIELMRQRVLTNAAGKALMQKLLA